MTSGGLAALVARASLELEAIVDDQVRRIRASEPDYARVPDEDLRAAAHQLLAGALRTLSGEAPLDPTDAAQTARRRAAQRVPLGPLLHAFRLGFTAIWERLLEHAAAAGPAEQLALLRGAESLWTVIDDYSRAVTEAYEQALADLAQVDAQRRLDALNALLEGRTADWLRLAAGPATVGLPPGADYVAVAAENDVGAPDPVQLLREAGLPCALRPASGLWLGVVALPARSSLTSLLDRLSRTWVGRAGVSEPYRDLTDTAVAVQDAAAAMRCLPPGTSGLVRSADDPLAVLLTHSPALAAAASAAFLRGADAAPDRAQLLETLADYLHRGSIAETAEALYVHRNTVGRRLRRVEELTGRQLSRPRDLAELYLAVRATQLLDRPPAP